MSYHFFATGRGAGSCLLYAYVPNTVSFRNPIELYGVHMEEFVFLGTVYLLGKAVV
jgi:hypothetical protein